MTSIDALKSLRAVSRRMSVISLSCLLDYCDYISFLVSDIGFKDRSTSKESACLGSCFYIGLKNVIQENEDSSCSGSSWVL